MNAKISLQDIEIISAYLDQAFSESEARKVELRIQQDAEFARFVQEFSYSKRLLRELPKKKAPRNFMLTPEQVKVHRSRWLFLPVLNFASAAAACLMAVMLIWPQWFLPAAQTAAAPETAMFAAALDTRAAVDATATPIIFTWNGGNDAAKGMGGGGGMANPETYSLGGGVGSSFSVNQSTEEPMTGVAAAGPSTDGSSNPILGIASPEEQGQIQSTPAETQTPGETEPAPQKSNPLLPFEIALGALAVVAALAAWLSRR
jgi:hypothetical protein